MRELFFRVDVNESIATGHIMRCLSIADAALLLGYKPVFILADDHGKNLVESRGYEVIVLNTSWADMESEVDAMMKAVQNRMCSVLILDSYCVTEKYLECISNLIHIIYIDDLGLVNYPVSGIVCYANYYRKLNHVERFMERNTHLFLGCEFVPLRNEFSNLPQKCIASTIRRILLLSGGADQYHILEKVLSVLAENTGLIIDVICGRYNSDYDKLCAVYKYNDDVHIHKSIDNIVDYMKNSDLAISAGGTTLYELSACGTPTITYSFADNQLDNVRQFDQDGLMPYLGDVRYDDIVMNLPKYVYRLQDTIIRKNISTNLQKLVDGNGAERLVRDISREAHFM